MLVSSQDFVHTFSMALFHKWDVKNGFAFVLHFFSLISDGLGGVRGDGESILSIYLYITTFIFGMLKIGIIFIANSKM